MTATAAEVPYLQRRGTRYSFRRIIPKQVAHRLGRREVKVALGTIDLSVARRRARVMANRFEETMEMVEKTPQISRDRINDLVRQYLAREWEFAERDLANPELEPVEESSVAKEAVVDFTRMITEPPSHVGFRCCGLKLSMSLTHQK